MPEREARGWGSYLCHYNAPKFLAELKDSTAQRFSQLVSVSFFGAFLMNAGPPSPPAPVLRWSKLAPV